MHSAAQSKAGPPGGRFQRWLNRRIPPARKITLDQKRIFIFPSAQGWFFALVLIVMLLAAINYQNNLVFALVFLLASLFVIAILHTYSNLSGLTIQALAAHPTFVGQLAEFELRLSRDSRREYYDVLLYWPDQQPVVASLTHRDACVLALHLPAPRRGVLRPGRLKLETRYPLGLLRAWTWLDLDVETLVYPRPIPCERRAVQAADTGEQGDLMAAAGSDDFDGFRAYQRGDPLRHAHWKAYARGLPLHTKQFAQYQENRFWLNWDEFEGMDVERRLGCLCFWLLRLEAAGDEYGLRLPDCAIAPARGEAHKHRCLRQLALWGSGYGD